MITPQLSFSVPACEYGDTSGIFPTGAQVIFTCSNGMDIPRFYVSSRSYSGARLNFVCYDLSFAVDREIAVTDKDFDKDGYMTIANLMSKILAVCGFAGYSDSSGLIGTVITKAHKDNVKGRTVRSILDDLSRSCVGFFTVQGDTGTAEMRGTLVLISVDSSFGAVFSAEKYTNIYIGGVKRFDKIIMTNGSRTYTAGGSSTAYGTLTIDTPYASDELMGKVYGRLKDYAYTAWECEKMLTDIVPLPSSLITFGEHKNMCANYCTVSFTPTGVYASVGRNAVSEDEMDYLNSTRRELALRYRLGDIMGNTKISEEGMKIVVDDKVNGKKEEYGFTAEKGGFTQFAGVMIDGKMPEKIIPISRTSRKMVYDDASYIVSWEFGEDGNKQNIKMVKEETA